MSCGAAFTRRAVLTGLGVGFAGCAGLAGCAGPGARGAAGGVGQRPAPDRTLRCVTWNIRHGEGTDGRVDLARIAASLARLAPDLVLLQEVDRGCRRSGGVDQPGELGALLGLESAFAAHRPFDGGEYGLAALSRAPILEARGVPLDAAPRPLIALAVAIDLSALVGFAGVGPLTAVGVHLVDTLDERAAEARAVLDTVLRTPGPFVVAGDFNGTRETAPIEVFAACDVATPPAPRETFPADAPTREIDFMVAGPPHRARWASSRVDAEALASDHRPVVAELRLL